MSDGGSSDDDGGLFDSFLAFNDPRRSKNRKKKVDSKEVADLKKQLQDAQWENFELKQKLNKKPINKEELSLIWTKPRLTVQMVADFIDKLPAKHKEKIWIRHAKNEWITIDNIVRCLHSFVCLCIKIKDRDSTTPTCHQIKDKLIIFSQSIQTKMHSSKGLSYKEFHNDLQHWVLQTISDGGNTEIKSHRQLRMSTKQLLSSDDRKNDELMIECVQCISKEVYGYEKTIHHFIDSADFQQLRQIHTAIRVAKGEDVQVEKEEAEQMFYRLLSPFYRLTVDCILRMCMFLQRSDVSAFKQVSHQISKICLKYMKMYAFKVCNVNKLWQQSEAYKNTPFLEEDWMNANSFEKDRCVMEMQFEWEKIYGIPVQEQLIYRNGFILKKDLQKWKDEFVGSIKVAERFCFIFDQRQIGIIESNKSDLRMMEADDCRILPEYHLVLLQYFDLLQQKLYFKQVLLVKKSVTANKILDSLTGYGNGNISLYKKAIDKYWNVLSSTKLTPNDTIVGKEECAQIVLMIQTENLSFKDNILIKGLKSEYKANEEKFCMDPNAFYEKLKGSFTLKVYYLHHATLFKAYLKTLYGANDELTASWNDILDSLADGKIMLNTFEMNGFNNYGTMRIKISQMLDKKAKAKRIELFRKSGDSLSVLPWNMKAHRYVQDNSVYFDFVDYDVDTVNDDDKKEKDDNPMVTYLVKILTPTQCKMPLMGSEYYNQINTTLILRYRYKFIFGKDFVDIVMDQLKESKNKECFEDVLGLYNDKNSDILYAMHQEKRTYFEKDEFEGDRDDTKVNRLNLLMYNNPKSVEKETPKDTFVITIRFLQSKDKDKSDAGYLSGIPLRLLVTEGQTLKDVMDRDMKQQCDVIEKVFRLEQQSMTLIYPRKCKPEKDDLFVLQVVNQDLYA